MKSPHIFSSDVFIFSGNIDQAQYCDKIKGIVDFLGTDLTSDELTMIWKMQVCITCLTYMYILLDKTSV